MEFWSAKEHAYNADKRWIDMKIYFRVVLSSLVQGRLLLQINTSTIAWLCSYPAFTGCLSHSEFFSCVLVNIIHTVLFLCCSTVRHIPLFMCWGSPFSCSPSWKVWESLDMLNAPLLFSRAYLASFSFGDHMRFSQYAPLHFLSTFTSNFVLWIHLFSLSLLSAASLCMANYVTSEQPNHGQKPLLKKWCFSCLFSWSRKVIEFV